MKTRLLRKWKSKSPRMEIFWFLVFKIPLFFFFLPKELRGQFTLGLSQRCRCGDLFCWLGCGLPDPPELGLWFSFSILSKPLRKCGFFKKKFGPVSGYFQSSKLKLFHFYQK